MKVGFYQFRPLFGKVPQNLLKVISVLRQSDADLLVLPELAFTGYYFRDRAEAMALAQETRDSPIVESLRALCREKRFYIVTGFTEKRLDKCFNSAVLIGPDGLIHTYRKLHLFNQERDWFDPGDTPLRVNLIDGARIGIMVCFDWVFPEAARVLALQGADIICHPSNLVLSHCQGVMLSRCLENRVFAITANRFGTDKRPHGTLKFTGKSQIADPDGIRLFQAPAQRELLHVIEIDPGMARDKHITALNDLMENRRPEFYRELTEK